MEFPVKNLSKETEETRPPTPVVPAPNYICNIANDSFAVEKFLDSEYVKGFLPPDEGTNLFDELMVLAKDGARALDRWGSDYESWMRVDEPFPLMSQCADRIRKYFKLSKDAVNSVLVNFYLDGESMYIPAHRDTVACLEEGSAVICVSLGATRDFVLCDNDDSGKFLREEMTVAREWAVGHGDLFALGQETNMKYCHAVPKDPRVMRARIALIFRSVSKSFIDLTTAKCPKAVTYANGIEKIFDAECIATKGYDDEGVREHIADLIQSREDKKRERQLLLLLQQSQSQSQENNKGVDVDVDVAAGDRRDRDGGGIDIDNGNINVY
eukprot:gene38124-49989_t